MVLPVFGSLHSTNDADSGCVGPAALSCSYLSEEADRNTLSGYRSRKSLCRAWATRWCHAGGNSAGSADITAPADTSVCGIAQRNNAGFCWVAAAVADRAGRSPAATQAASQRSPAATLPATQPASYQRPLVASQLQPASQLEYLLQQVSMWQFSCLLSALASFSGPLTNTR